MSDPYDRIAKTRNAPPPDLVAIASLDRHIDDTYRRSTYPAYVKFETFLSRPEFTCAARDQKMNIWEQGNRYRLLHIPAEYLDEFFHLYDECRKLGITLNFTEKQNPVASGVRLDFDIYQDVPGDTLTNNMIDKLCENVVKTLSEIFPLEAECERDTDYKIVTIVTKRPVISEVEREGRKQWKSGLHIDIPSVKCSRNAKRLIIQQLLEKRVMTRVFGSAHPHAENYLDQASSSVPLVLFGSCKEGGTAYKIIKVRQYHVDGPNNVIGTDDNKFLLETQLNQSMEMSVNYSWDQLGANAERTLVKKIEFAPRATWSSELMALDHRNERNSEQVTVSLINDLNHLTVNDPNAEHLKLVLDCLKPQRYDDRKEWFKIIYVLVRSNSDYVPLARWFSMKSTKYDAVEFDKSIEQIKTLSLDKITVAMLHHMAKSDNPVMYLKAQEQSCRDLLYKYVFDSITEGKLGHTHFAELLHVYLRNKYVTDFNGRDRVWYEFKFPGEQHELGQVYKWTPITYPDSLDLYMHRKLSKVCFDLLDYMTKRRSDSSEATLVKYWVKLSSNVRGSARGLWTTPFKIGVLRQAEVIFSQPGFIKSLDQDAMCLGVGNGVLHLSREGAAPKLLKAFHGFKISRSTETMYEPMDPEDPLTLRLLGAMRNMFPEDESDTFEYVMSYISASIDNRPREAIMLLLTGAGSNGKSVLLSLITSMLGAQYSCAMPFSMLICNREDSPESAKPMLMQLVGARLAVYSEGPSNAIMYMPMVKRLTGGDAMAVRPLYGNAINIRARCMHLVMSNHDFMILTHEEATWRRLRYVKMMMTFRDAAQYDASNPFHRKIDHMMNSEFFDHAETRKCMLSICVFFHMKLMRYWDGIVDHVPHPNVETYTSRFRNSQDTVNRFISERVVMCVDAPEPLDADVEGADTKLMNRVTLEDVVVKYRDWYTRNIKSLQAHDNSQYMKEFRDSSLMAAIEETARGTCLKRGYRALGSDEDLKTGEIMYRPKITRVVTKPSGVKEFPDETTEQYILRFKREHALLMATEPADANDVKLMTLYSKQAQNITATALEINMDEHYDERPEAQQPVEVDRTTDEYILANNAGMEYESDVEDFEIPSQQDLQNDSVQHALDRALETKPVGTRGRTARVAAVARVATRAAPTRLVVQSSSSARANAVRVERDVKTLETREKSISGNSQIRSDLQKCVQKQQAGIRVRAANAAKSPANTTSDNDSEHDSE